VFIDKNGRGESTIYALSDLKVREDSTFNKDYLQGKYGAIPIFDYSYAIFETYCFRLTAFETTSRADCIVG